MSRKKIRVTSHARSRAKERLDVAFHTEVNKKFNDAIKYGHTVKDYVGEFATYLSYKNKKQKRGVVLKVHGDLIILYRTHTVITTYKVPPKFLPTSQYLRANYEEFVYLQELYKEVGKENVDYEVFEPSLGDSNYVTGLYVNDIFEGFGRGTTKAKSINNVAKSYLKKLGREVEDDEEL